MNRSWTLFLIIAILLMLVVTGYEFYYSISGANVTFNKTVSSINPKLGTEKIETFTSGSEYMIVKDSDLDEK